MTAAEVIPAFLDVCPTMRPAWQKYLDFWGGDPERGHYNDTFVVAQHFVDNFDRGDLSEFPAAFALLERCLAESDEKTRDLATIGIMEFIQSIASHRPFGPGVFYEWLGPRSRSAWDELCESWRQVAEAKAAAMSSESGNR
jgi:hypothetical protein